MIIIDTDGGVDDMLSIIISTRLVPNEIIGISSVFGNINVDQALENIKYSLEIAKYSNNIFLGKGANCALDGFVQFAENIHGKDGLGSARLIRSQEENHRQSIELNDYAIAIRNKIDETGIKVKILGIGPATNIPMLVKILGKDRIEHIVLVSGVLLDKGNVSDYAEFNAYNDPLALKQTLTSGVRVTLVPLDLCRKILLTYEKIQKFENLSSINIKPLVAALKDYSNNYRRWANIEGCFPHDAIGLLVLLRPDKFYIADTFIDINLSGERRGCTTIKTINHSKRNSQVAFGGDLKWVRWMIEEGWLEKEIRKFN